MFQDADQLISCLRQCSRSKNLSGGKLVHSQLVRAGRDRETYFGNLLVQMYSNCGRVEDACMIFSNINQRNVFSWNIMVAGYIENGDLQGARRVFENMPRHNAVSWTSMFTAHAQNGHLLEAERMFGRMPERDMVSWNGMIAAYAQNGHLQEARGSFAETPQRNVVTWTTLVAAYAQKGNLQEARDLFDKMPEQNVVSWNAMISGYALNGNVVAARDLFGRMPQRSTVSWNAILSAYARNGYLEEGRLMLEEMPDRDRVSWTTMISAYGQNGQHEEARHIFYQMPDKDLVSWTAMISAYAQNGQAKKAMHLFRTMDLEGMQVDKITLVTVVDACANLAGLSEGKLIHAEVVATGVVLDGVLGNALVSMYGKCGSLENARQVFDNIVNRQVISWNAMITAYAQNGQGTEAVQLFRGMMVEGVELSEITFVSVLLACSHAGLLEDGLHCVHSGIGDYGLKLSSDHYVCIVDLLCRSGHLLAAEELIDSMPFEPNDVAWKALLSGCRLHDDVVRGVRAAEQIFELEDPQGACDELVGF